MKYLAKIQLSVSEKNKIDFWGIAINEGAATKWGGGRSDRNHD